MELIKDRKIRCALVGFGRVAKNHIDAIRAHKDDLSLVGICDVNEAVVKPYCDEIGVEFFNSLDALLETDVDVVTLCTPSGLHARQAIKIATAGKHVISEKPMATRWQDGLDMVRVCDDANVRLFVVKQNRYNSTMQALKQAVSKERFGKIQFVQLNVFWHRPQSYYDMSPWRGTWEFDGGALMNQASHYVDMLHWLIGPIDRLHAMMGTLARQVETEDTATLNIRWRSGTIGSVNVTNLVHDIDLEGSVTIIGEKGRVKIGGKALNKIESWEFVDKEPEDETVFEASYETDSVYGFGHEPYYKNVVDVFRGKAEPLTDGRDGLKSLEIIIAAYLSARDHCEVALPLEY